MAPKGESKINPRDAWVFELNEDFLNLLTYVESLVARNPSFLLMVDSVNIL
jgi:hypothetical protein